MGLGGLRCAESSLSPPQPFSFLVDAFVSGEAAKVTRSVSEGGRSKRLSSNRFVEFSNRFVEFPPSLTGFTTRLRVVLIAEMEQLLQRVDQAVRCSGFRLISQGFQRRVQQLVDDSFHTPFDGFEVAGGEMRELGP